MIKLLLLLLCFPLASEAEIFQWKDKKGNTHFSDQPHPGAKTLQIDSGYSYYQVKKVYDGDTVLLTNGSKVRLLGINTPEVEGRTKSLQAGGEEAKRWLIEKLKNKKVRLDKDVEKHDKYGRLLAHIFTDDEEHINLTLVKKGYASVNIHPPNLKYTDDLLKAQEQAEQAKLGIWKYGEYKLKQVSEINRSNYKGWQRVTGRVLDAHHTHSSIYLKLSDSFSLKVKKKYFELFPDFNHYADQQVEVRGWVNKQKKRFVMLIRHPSQIKLR